MITIEDKIFNQINQSLTQLNANLETQEHNGKTVKAELIQIQIDSLNKLKIDLENTKFIELSDEEFDTKILPTESVAYIVDMCYYRKSLLNYDDFYITCIVVAEYLNYLSGYYTQAIKNYKQSDRQKSVILLYLYHFGLIDSAKRLPYSSRQRGHLFEIYETKYGKWEIPLPIRHINKSKLILKYILENKNNLVSYGICTEDVEEFHITCPIAEHLTEGKGFRVRWMASPTIYYDKLNHKILRNNTLKFREYEEEIEVLVSL